jgi:hypothetical protein
MLRQWGKQSNKNHSEKIRALNWFFIDGKDPEVKARFSPGQELSNVNKDLKIGLITDVFAWLIQLKNRVDGLIKLGEQAKQLVNRIDFYQITVRTTIKDGIEKPLFYCKHLDVYKIEDIYECLKPIATKFTNNFQQFITREYDENMNDEDLKKVWPLFDTIANFEKFEEKSHYIAVRSKLAFELKDIVNDKSQNYNIVSWHLLGEDYSQCAENYKLMEEFSVLPCVIDLGRVEELKIR